MNEWVHNHRCLLICIALAITTFAVYLPVVNYQFINYDDNAYVVENPYVRSGLSWENVKWGFTAVHDAYWQPLTWFSYMLDCTLFGLNAGAFHLTNVLFHIANTIFLFLILTRMTKGVWQSAFIAGLFALHPLHAESVAWIAERRDVLSTLFWLLTMLSYARYAERPSAGRYLVTVAVFILGLLSKPMLVTLPFVLLLLDYWPLERFGNARYRLLHLLLEKVPFIILSAIASAITFLTSQKTGTVADILRLPLNARIINAVVSYLIYIGKMIWPAGLAVLYPHPGSATPVSRAVIYGTILVLITIFFVCYCRRYKYLLVGWLWYLGTLVPVIGIVQVGTQAMADRYTYIPLIGLFVIIAFGATELLEERPFGKIVLGVLAGISLSACVVVTSHQLKYWKDGLSLFGHALAVTKDNYVMHSNYAIALNECGRRDEAASHFAEALRLIPELPEIRNNYGNALREMGKLDEAIAQYKIVIKLAPDFKLARYDLGLALAAKGDYEGAIEQYRLYAGTSVDVADIHQGLGAQLAEKGKFDDALGQFQQALIVNPDSTEVLSNFGFALAQSGKLKEAIEYYDKVLAKDPNNVITHGRLALALASVGRIDEAIEQCRIVLAARPDDFEMYNNLGMLLQNQGKLDEAIESYKKALQISPNFPKARENLDTALAQKQAGK
jgi:tetratricopeptide (TPR) repeat protein